MALCCLAIACDSFYVICSALAKVGRMFSYDIPLLGIRTPEHEVSARFDRHDGRRCAAHPAEHCLCVRVRGLQSENNKAA